MKSAFPTWISILLAACHPPGEETATVQGAHTATDHDGVYGPDTVEYGSVGTDVLDDFGKIVFQTNFNTGLDGFTILHSATSRTPDATWIHDVDPPVASGNQNGALWFTRPASPGDYSTGNREFGFALSPEFDLSGRGNVLRFRTFERTQGEGKVKDTRKVWLIIPGQPWKLLADSSFQTAEDDDAMKAVYLSLDAHATAASKKVRVAFGFDTVDGVDNAHEGWVIDDVRVTRHDVPVIDWEEVSSLGGVPSTAELDGRVWFAAVGEADKVLRTRSTDLSGAISPVTSLFSNVAFSTVSPPRLFRVGHRLTLFAVTADGSIQAWSRTKSSTSWLHIGSVMTDAIAIDTMSIAVTGTKEIHLAVRIAGQRTTSSYTRYMLLEHEGTYLHVAKSDNLFTPDDKTTVDVALASDGVDRLFVLVQSWSSKKWQVYDAHRSTGWSLVYRGAPAAVPATNASAVFHQGRFFFYYGDTAGNLRGYHVEPTGTLIAEDFAMGSSGPIALAKTTAPPTAIEYYNTILVAYRGPGSFLRYLRRERMAGKFGTAATARHPYQGGGLIGAEGWRPLGPLGAPSLVVVGQEVYVAAASSAIAKAGAAQGSSEVAARWLCLTRSIFKVRLAEIGMPVVGYNAYNDYGGYSGYPDLDLTMPVYRLGFLTRAGRASWDLPEWIVDTYFIDLTAAKEGEPAGGTVSGLHGPTRILLTSNEMRANYRPDGARHDPGDTSYTVWEEWGHWLYDGAIAKKFGGVAVFSDTAVSQASALGAKPTPLPPCAKVDAAGTCQERRRGYFGSYESPEFPNSDASASHAFIYMVLPYYALGDTYRARIAADEAVDLDLLGKKYAWAKQHVFGGTEFDDQGAPLP